MFRQLWRDEEGLATVEYALLLMLIVVCSIAAWSGLGNAASGSVTVSANTLPH